MQPPTTCQDLPASASSRNNEAEGSALAANRPLAARLPDVAARLPDDGGDGGLATGMTRASTGLLLELGVRGGRRRARRWRTKVGLSSGELFDATRRRSSPRARRRRGVGASTGGAEPRCCAPHPPGRPPRSRLCGGRRTARSRDSRRPLARPPPCRLAQARSIVPGHRRARGLNVAQARAAPRRRAMPPAPPTLLPLVMPSDDEYWERKADSPYRLAGVISAAPRRMSTRRPVSVCGRTSRLRLLIARCSPAATDALHPIQRSTACRSNRCRRRAMWAVACAFRRQRVSPQARRAFARPARPPSGSATLEPQQLRRGAALGEAGLGTSCATEPVRLERGASRRPPQVEPLLEAERASGGGDARGARASSPATARARRQPAAHRSASAERQSPRVAKQRPEEFVASSPPTWTTAAAEQQRAARAPEAGTADRGRTRGRRRQRGLARRRLALFVVLRPAVATRLGVANEQRQRRFRRPARCHARAQRAELAVASLSQRPEKKARPSRLRTATAARRRHFRTSGRPAPNAPADRTC